MPNTSDYSAAKFALTRLTESIASELEGSGISIFAISPGTVRTDMTRGIEMFRSWTDWDSPDAAGILCTAIASRSLDPLSRRFLDVREGIEAFISSADAIIDKELHVLRMSRLPMSGACRGKPSASLQPSGIGTTARRHVLPPRRA